jgi:tRNA(Arg) A34 adenosine deaminase TadA
MCDHAKFLSRAVEISGERMRAGDGGPFGAVIVKDGKVIAEGHNQVTSANDPTAHAEVVAIREACVALSRFDLSGCVIYASCEPCPMCLAAIYWARLEQVYYTNTREDAARIGFDDAAIYEEIGKPIGQRTIPMTRIDLSEAEAIFEEWLQMEDRVSY